MYSKHSVLTLTKRLGSIFDLLWVDGENREVIERGSVTGITSAYAHLNGYLIVVTTTEPCPEICFVDFVVYRQTQKGEHRIIRNADGSIEITKSKWVPFITMPQHSGTVEGALNAAASEFENWREAGMFLIDEITSGTKSPKRRGYGKQA